MNGSPSAPPASEPAVVLDAKCISWATGLSVCARWLLGGLFIYLGLSKALHPVEFLKLVRQYELVNQAWVLNSIAAALPWFEVFCGVLMLAGVAVRGSALMLLCMLLPFTLAVLRRALEMSAAQHLPLCALRFDCGCGTGEVWICRKLVENCGLILLAAWLMLERRRALCLRFTLLRKP